jgi:hypothetical protein
VADRARSRLVVGFQSGAIAPASRSPASFLGAQSAVPVRRGGRPAGRIASEVLSTRAISGMVRPAKKRLLIPGPQWESQQRLARHRVTEHHAMVSATGGQQASVGAQGARTWLHAELKDRGDTADP